MRWLVLALALAGCASSADAEDACGELDGARLVYDLTSLTASTPECRKAVATVDLTSGAFALTVRRDGAAWQVETGGAVYTAVVDPMRACSVKWDVGNGTKLHAVGELDREQGRSFVHYEATSDAASCEVTLTGTSR